MIVEVGTGLHAIFATAEQAKGQALCMLNTVHFVQIGGSQAIPEGASNLSLSTIDAFCKTMLDTISKHRQQPVVVCLEDSSLSTFHHAYGLLCAYLI